MMSFLSAVLSHPICLLTIGGAVGTNARYWLSVWIHNQNWTDHFPLATFLINVSGSLLLGVCVIPFHTRLPVWWLLLGVGFCGGYTTFSTFAWETYVLIHEKQQPNLAVLNILASVVISCAAVWFSISALKTMHPANPAAPVMGAADPETQTEP